MSARTRIDIRTAALWAGGFVLLALPTFLAFRTGAYLAQDQLLGLIIALLVLMVVAVVAPWPLITGRYGLLALAALSGFALWTGLSISWARLIGWALDDTGRLTLYAVAFAGGLICFRVPGLRRLAPWVLMAGVSVVALYAIGGRLLPELIPTQPIGAAGTRLAQPITYWNGEGFLFAAGTLLAIACAADRSAAVWARAGACALTVPCGFACFLTLSRGAFIAVFGGLVVLAIMRPLRSTLAAIVIGLGPTAVLIVSLVAFDAPRTLVGSESEIQSQGTVVAILGVLAMAVAGGVMKKTSRSPVLRGRLIDISPRLAPMLAIGAVVVIIVGTVAISYSSEQTEDIATSGARLGEVKTYRGPYWKVALNSFSEHPVIGVGSGSYQVEWRRERDTGQFTYNAHSLYFETLAELGIIGGLLLALLYGSVGTGLVRAARAEPRDPVVAAAAALAAAFAIHVAVDWDWELPAVTLPVLLTVAAALAHTRHPPVDSAA